MVAGAGRSTRTRRSERPTLRYALLGSILFHLGLLLLVRVLPATEKRPTPKPLTFTLLERPARPAPVKPPAVLRPAEKGPGSPGARPSGHAAPPLALKEGTPAQMPVTDTPLAKETAAGPSLRDMSEASAEAVVTKRGPQHTPGQSTQERLAESLGRGTGAMAVARGGFWDAYFTLLRKALLKAWVGDQREPRFGEKATTRIRVVLDADGLLRDFDIVAASGNPTLDKEVEQALHQTTQFPPPPDNVMHGKLELVTEWEMTVHPGLAQAAGTPTFGPFGAAMVFDLVTVVNPKVDLTPLEFNVALATYWTR